MELKDLSWSLPLWQDAEARQLLAELCAKYGVPESVLFELVAIEHKHQHRARAAGIYEEIDEVLEQMAVQPRDAQEVR